MANARAQFGLYAVALFVMCVPTVSAYAAPPGSTYEAITRVADRLVNTQNKVSPGYVGTWQGETDYTGTMAAGLVEAYQMTGDGSYRQAAELAGTWIINNAGGCNYYGDDAYALMRLSQISCDPANNNWRANLTQFYECVRTGTGGTQGYIDAYWAGSEVCTSVFYLAEHTMAAYYVNAQDKDLWRQNLIKFLSRVNGYAEYSGETLSEWPVYSLGVATWALAEIHRLDTTPINIDGYGDQYWGTKQAKDLPAILKSHRSDETLYVLAPGSFYCWFDHKPAGAMGYTEDNIFGLLGLAAAQNNYSVYSYDHDTAVVWSQTLGAIADTGDVYGHVVPATYPMSPFKYYAGELLTSFGRSALSGDINLNDHVDFVDLAAMAASWLSNSGCDCDISDLSRDRFVNFTDFAILAKGWTKSRTP
jgi:hypothetical protein